MTPRDTFRDERSAHAEMVHRSMTDDEWDEGMRQAFGDESDSALDVDQELRAKVLRLLALVALMTAATLCALLAKGRA